MPSDEYTYNNPKSLERLALNSFLELAQMRVSDHPEKLPFKAVQGHLVINWLRNMLDMKPSDLAKTDIKL
jgi:hypothetical protein